MKLKKNPLTSFELPGYNIKYTPTKCNNLGMFLYVKKGINYKLRKHLQICRSKQLKSTFIEVFRNKRENNDRFSIQTPFCDRDLSKQFLYLVDGTKKFNHLTEFGNSVFIKFYFEAYQSKLASSLHSK